MLINKIWDKESEINGVPSEKLLQDNPFMRTDDIVLVSDGVTGKVFRIESVQILAGIAGINSSGKNPLQIFEEFERIQKEDEEKIPNEMSEIEQLKQQIIVQQSAINMLLGV